jgi:D-alanine-D-alanine ligase
LEREISLRSGHHVAPALRHRGYEVAEVDVDEELSGRLESADCVFVALHGRDGEDGTIQLVCESLGVPYTGSAPLTCRICFDKGLAKGLLHQADLPTPPAFVLSVDAIRHMGAGNALKRAASRVGFPLVVKPSAQGSGLGITIVESPSELNAAALTAFNHGDRVLLERFVHGTDVSVALHGPDLTPLPAVEIRTQSKVFDFETRVSPGAFEFVCPTDLDGSAVRDAAVRAAQAVGLRDFGRVDFRIGDDGPTILDVKTCPGLTETSILPFAASAGGVSFDDFVGDVLDAALARATTAKA